MAFYRGKEERHLLVDKLVDLLTTAPTGSTEPYWKQVQTGSFQDEGYILHSTGKSGKDNIYIRFHYEPFENCITMSMLEDYTPNPIDGLVGTIENESHAQHIYYHNYQYAGNVDRSNSSSSYASAHPVHYILSFDKDKVMLVLKGDPKASSSTYLAQTLAWIGMPTRLVEESDSSAAAFAVSAWANSLVDYQSSGYNIFISKCALLRNRNKDKKPLYHMRSLDNFKTKGWSGHLLLSNIYLEDDASTEGVRAIMDGVHPIHQDSNQQDFNDGDEITVGSKRFTVLKVHQYSQISDYDTNCFPSEWMAVEQLS